MRARWALFVALFWVVAPQIAGAEDAYERLVREAVAAHATGNYEAAHALLEEAHQLAPSARTLRGMGLGSYQAGKYARAVRELEAALEHPVKPLDARLRLDAEALLTRARTKVAIVRLRIQPRGAQVVVENDSRPRGSSERLVLEPGAVKLRLSAEGHVSQVLGLELRAGTEQVLSVALVPAPTVAPEPPVPAAPALPQARSQDAPPPVGEDSLWTVPSITLASVAGAALVGSGALFTTEKLRTERIADSCAELAAGCSVEQRSQEAERAKLQPLRTGAITLLAVGAGAALLTGGWLVWSRLRARPVQVTVHPTGVGLRGRF